MLKVGVGVESLMWEGVMCAGVILIHAFFWWITVPVKHDVFLWFFSFAVEWKWGVGGGGGGAEGI